MKNEDYRTRKIRVSRSGAGYERTILAEAERPPAKQTAEEVLRRLSRAVEQTADGICISDRNGTIEFANPAFERLFGYRRHELLGASTRTLRSGHHDAGFYRSLWSTLLSGAPFRRVFIDRKADGQLVHVDETITPILDSTGAITHFVATVRDISARIRVEEALRRLNDSLEQQAKRIAQTLHDDSGQMLTAANIALADAARGLPAAAQDRLREVKAHLDTIEAQLRSVAYEIRPRVLDDAGLVPALEFLTRSVERRWGVRMTLTSELHERLPPPIETAVYRLVQEGLTNVTRHAKAAHVEVRLERTPIALRCEITDDGVGFDASASTSSNGLGLRGIVDRLAPLGGTLRVESANGRGTRLSATIPLGE